MAKIAALMTGGGGYQPLTYDRVKEIVEAQGHTYELVSPKVSGTDRFIVIEGGVYYDSINGNVYVYAYLRCNYTQTPTSWNGAVMFDGAGNISPSKANSSACGVIQVEETTATNDPVFNAYAYDNMTHTYIGATKKYTVGETYKVWGAWTVRV